MTLDSVWDDLRHATRSVASNRWTAVTLQCTRLPKVYCGI